MHSSFNFHALHDIFPFFCFSPGGVKILLILDGQSPHIGRSPESSRALVGVGSVQNYTELIREPSDFMDSVYDADRSGLPTEDVEAGSQGEISQLLHGLQVSTVPPIIISRPITSCADYNSFHAMERSHVKLAETQNKPTRNTDPYQIIHRHHAPLHCQDVLSSSPLPPPPPAQPSFSPQSKNTEASPSSVNAPFPISQVRLAMSSGIGLCFKQHIMSRLFDMLLLHLAPYTRGSHYKTLRYVKSAEAKRTTTSL